MRAQSLETSLDRGLNFPCLPEGSGFSQDHPAPISRLECHLEAHLWMRSPEEDYHPGATQTDPGLPEVYYSLSQSMCSPQVLLCRWVPAVRPQLLPTPAISRGIDRLPVLRLRHLRYIVDRWWYHFIAIVLVWVFSWLLGRRIHLCRPRILTWHLGIPCTPNRRGREEPGSQPSRRNIRHCFLSWPVFLAPLFPTIPREPQNPTFICTYWYPSPPLLLSHCGLIIWTTRGHHGHLFMPCISNISFMWSKNLPLILLGQQYQSGSFSLFSIAWSKFNISNRPFPTDF